MRGQGAAGQPLLAFLLAAALLPASRGGVFINPDTSYYLFQPFTDAEHRTACPGSDPRLCPILQTSFPRVELQQAIGGFNVRAQNALSALEISRGAHTAFWLYDYSFDQATQTHTYRTHTGAERATIFFEYTFGRMFLQDDWKTCGPFVVDLEELEGIMVDTAEATPLKFDVTATFRDMNCFLGKLWFRASDDVKSTEAQLSSNGGLPFIRYTVDDPFGSAQFNGLFLARTIYAFNEVTTAPLLVDCPAFQYPVAWTRAQSGVCLTSPAKDFPLVESTSANCSVQAISPGSSDMTYRCTRCGHSRSTFYYAMEDDPRDVVLEGLDFNDLSIFYGTISMAFKIKFNVTNGNTPLVIDFFLSAYTVESSTQTYCATAKTSTCADLLNGCIGQGESCATTPESAFGGAWVPTSSGTDFTQYAFRIPHEPQNAVMCISGSAECGTCPNPEQVPAATGPEYCPCLTGLCFVLNQPVKGHSRVHTSVFGSNVASSTLFWEFYDAANPSVVLQYGVITARLARPSGAGTVWDLSGTMAVAPLTSTTRGRRINWYMASPLAIEGTYDESTEILSITRATSRPDSGTRVSMSVTAQHGSLQLPAYATESPRELTMFGTLRQLNFALKRIQYTPDWPVGFNTQSKSTSERLISPENIRIMFNKTDVNQGKQDALGIGDLTTFDFAITVVAVNKGPNITSKNHPSHPAYVVFSTSENSLAHFPGVVIFDNDVDQVFTSEVGTVPQQGQCPAAPEAVLHTMTADLKVRHGTLLFNVTDSLAFANLVVRDVQGVLRRIPTPDMNLMRRLTQKQGDVRCGLDDLFLCISIPSGFFFPASRFDRIVWIGAREVTVTGTQACLNSMFDGLFYRTDEDYNNNVPEKGIPLDAIGCPADPDPIPSDEDLYVRVTDNGNTGCTDLDPLEANITISMIVEGVTSPLAIKMPDGLVLNEDTSLSFTGFECPPDKTSVCGAPQMITRDNGDLTVAVRLFELTLAVRHGTLYLGAKENVTFVIGSGKNDRSMTIQARLCTLNQAIRTLSYVPDPNFNTERFQKVNGTWQKEKEILSFSVVQPLGPPGYAERDITVFAVNDAPTIQLIRPDGLPDTETPTMTTAMAEIYMCGGDVSCACPSSAISCIRIEDVDACEGKGIKGLECWDDTEDEGNVRLVVKSIGTDIFFFDSEDLGCNAGASQGEGSCTTEGQRQALLTENVMRSAMTGASVGTTLNSIEIIRPLPQLQRGVLRLWANQKTFGPEAVTVSIEDQGSTGANGVLATEAVFVMMNVTSCQTVEGWRCSGSAGVSASGSRIVDGGTLPGYGIILVGLLCAGIVFLGCVGIFYFGLGSLDPVGSRSKGLAELSELNKELGSEVTGRAARAKGLEAFGPWSRAIDNRGCAYWYNRITRETTWLDPRITQMGREGGSDEGMDAGAFKSPPKSAGSLRAQPQRRKDEDGEIQEAEPRGIIRAMLRRPGDQAGGLYPDIQEDGFQGRVESPEGDGEDDILGGREFEGDKSLVTNLLMHTSSYMMNRSSKKEEDIEMLAV